MSTTYRAVEGDTFASVSRKVYGTERYARNIERANPDQVEPLSPGSTLAVPAIPAAPKDKNTRAPVTGPNETAVLIDGRRFRFWSDIRVTRSLDGMDTVEFSAPFEPDAPGFRDTFRPFSYKPLVVTVGGGPLFSGTMVDVAPDLAPDSKAINVSGYALPGVLSDCTAPGSAYPLEYNKQALPEIAASLCEPFGVAVRFDGPAGAAFERVALEPGAPVLRFLSDLARQRGLVVSSTPDGELLFRQSVTPGQPRARLSQGASPVTAVTPSFSPQQYFSHVTGLESVLVGTSGSQYTASNPHLAGTLRPHTFASPDVQGGGIADSVRAKLGRMFGNMAAYAVSVDTWRDSGGELWAPNTTVTLSAPAAMAYSQYEFIVRSVRFSRTGDKETAALDLVLPGSFDGKAPEVLPWD